MSEVKHAGAPADFRALYDAALPEVFGYLMHRCSSRMLAEDLTQEVFLAAARSIREGTAVDFGVGWLIGVARHKLVDHYRREERERRKLELVTEQVRIDHAATDGEPLDRERAMAALDDMPAPQRLALTLRYFDGLAVPEIATHLGRSVHATESILARARDGFRRRYTRASDD
ncbi:MAG TPA: sigma-70 family RNA polymerase sigma factor [Mycobacteriales bacterium]|nr:sigma-70 family RNA polymerase sigma factor [Mycobacteriales bacterium]